MKKKKSRQSRIGLDFGGPATITGIGQNEDGSLTFFGSDGKPLPVQAGSAGLQYERVKGPKITCPAVGSLAAALARYTHIVGVDTNSLMHGGENTCVTRYAS